MNLFSREELETLLEGLEAIEKNLDSGNTMATLVGGLLAGRAGREEANYRAVEEEVKKEHFKISSAALFR